MAGIAGFFIDKVTFHAYDPAVLSSQGRFTKGAPISRWDKEVDASEREGHGFKILTPKHPVFRGIPVTDNARPEPDEFTCNVFFTNAGSRVDESIIKLLQDSAESVRQSFEDFAKQGFVWGIDTSLKIYKNMMLNSGDVERTVRNGNSVHFGLRFTEVRSATVSFTTVTTRDPSTSNNAPVNKKGSQVGASIGLDKTVAANIVDGVKAWFK